MKDIFERSYDGESIVDLSRDIYEAIDEHYNPVMKEIPTDQNGFMMGRFVVSIKWEKDS